MLLIHRLAAKTRIEDAQYRLPEVATKTEILSLSSRFNLVSRHTWFHGIHCDVNGIVQDCGPCGVVSEVASKDKLTPQCSRKKIMQLPINELLLFGK